MTHPITTCGLVFVSVLLGFGMGAMLVPPQTAQAAAPGYKVRMISGAVEDAREAVENGETPQQDCTMVSMQGRSIIEDHPDDENAVVVASEAMEACSFDLPVAFFGTKLDTVQEQLAGSPESPLPCKDFVSEFTIYFSVAGTALPNAADPEERVKAALSERALEICPFAAEMMGF